MINPKQTPERKTGEIIPFKTGVTDGAAAAVAAPAPALTFTWEALERQLTDLAVSERCRALAPTLISATRKQAPFKPPEMVLREVLCIASVLMDATFHPDGEEGEMT